MNIIVFEIPIFSFELFMRRMESMLAVYMLREAFIILFKHIVLHICGLFGFVSYTALSISIYYISKTLKRQLITLAQIC